MRLVITKQKTDGRTEKGKHRTPNGGLALQHPALPRTGLKQKSRRDVDLGGCLFVLFKFR
ncbi:MAG: hypothetical protein DMF40_13370 [Verrucomicrobia bacterium]|nr:MAG: hypothetical protein DMF40_13370 [Verrucomicrobiota bacterium]